MAEARWYPALDVRWPQPPPEEAVDRLLALLDDFSPAAVEPLELGPRVFFSNESLRDQALAAVRVSVPDVTCELLTISDEAWAERSQASLTAVTVGRVTVAPPWGTPVATNDPSSVTITILPSMGFGTGHHASTRLCLGLLQTVELTGRRLVDVGTGSGVLAIAAARLGALRVLAIDYDADALTSAHENVDANDGRERIQLLQFDLTADDSLPDMPFDVVTANLTGAMIIRHAAVLARWVAAGGTLVASGFQLDEEPSVRSALASFHVSERLDEADWVALKLERHEH